MPYLCRVTISGPEPDADGVSQMMDAVSSAIEAGWEAPWVIVEENGEAGDGSSDDDSPDGAVLDYRVFGYPGGAIILVVLDSGDLMQTSLAVTGLAQHLTTWSPGLLEYSPDEVKISIIDKPYDGENWLPPVDEEEEDDSERVRWHLAELLDDELREMASEYLLACGIRSLWNPADPVLGHWARDIVAGAVEDPWGSELTSALGALLISAARLENSSGSPAKLVVQGCGEPELAADLLQQARATGPEPETDGWADDEMRGHVLVERFMEEHQLLWNRVLDDESPAETEDRSNRQLRALLWAGLRALATMAMPLARLSGPWQVLGQLGGGTVVSILAEVEEEQNEEDAEEDLEEVESAAAAHVLAWLAIRRPELLDDPATDSLIDQVTQDASAFHHVFYAAMVMAGSGPLKAALEEKPAPAQLQDGITDFADALATTEDRDAAEPADAHDDMHAALDLVLDEGPGLDERIRYLLAVAGLAARFTDSDANPHRAVEGHVSTPRTLTHYLLVEPAMQAAVVLHRHDDDAAVRTRMTSLAAQVAPSAAGDMAAELPGLTGDDPRIEPASRARARRWIENARQLAREQGSAYAPEADLGCSADALTLLNAASANLDLPDDWPADRFVSAGAEAAAAVLHAIGRADLAEDVFDE
jgi:hypothetical protein